MATTTIEITGFLDENLVLNSIGLSNPDICELPAGEIVRWAVRNNCGVRNIRIERKAMSGTTDIFSSSPPSPTTLLSTVWEGQINSAVARDPLTYAYNIHWTKELDGSTHLFDPIISIRPTTSRPHKLIPLATFAGTLILAFSGENEVLSLTIAAISGVLTGIYYSQFVQKNNKF